MFESIIKLQKYKDPVKKRPVFIKNYDDQEDLFVGLSVPNTRKLAKEYYKKISQSDLDSLFKSRIHDYRLLALIILENQMEKANPTEQKRIVEYYLDNLDYVNNWDLVDASAYKILGRYLYQITDFDLLYELSESENLWYKRISVVSTYYLIKRNELNVPLDIIDNLLEDKHDLIHKANGWMLRNIGDQNREILTEYLYINYQKIPRTTLRYAIEHYREDQRKAIIKGDFQWR